MGALIEMNSVRSPGEKLGKLVHCSELIFLALGESATSGKRAVSADEFLPALIHVLIIGNPPLVQSNLNFVQRFALQRRRMSGQAGYFFTNLVCAKNFVQNMGPDSLKLSREEFEAYTSGQLAPPRSEANCGAAQALSHMQRLQEQLQQFSDRMDKASI